MHPSVALCSPVPCAMGVSQRLMRPCRAALAAETPSGYLGVGGVAAFSMYLRPTQSEARELFACALAPVVAHPIVDTRWVLPHGLGGAVPVVLCRSERLRPVGLWALPAQMALPCAYG